MFGGKMKTYYLLIVGLIVLCSALTSGCGSDVQSTGGTPTLATVIKSSNVFATEKAYEDYMTATAAKKQDVVDRMIASGQVKGIQEGSTVQVFGAPKDVTINGKVYKIVHIQVSETTSNSPQAAGDGTRGFIDYDILPKAK